MIQANTVITGDSLTVLRDMEADSVDMVITDPPYGVDYQSARKDKARRFAKIANDKAPFVWWIYDAARVLKHGGGVLCFTRWDVQQVFIDALRLAGLTVKSVIVWDKKAHGMGDLKGSFAPRYEAIIFAVKGRYELPGKRPDDLIACAKVGNQRLAHPNEKPVELLDQLIVATTVRGALILDPFAGSGSTLVAAAKNCRQYVGIEIDEQYSKLAAARIAKCNQTNNFFTKCRKCRRPT